MGGVSSGEPRPRGDRGGSQLRGDVWRTESANQDRPARCRGLDDAPVSGTYRPIHRRSPARRAIQAQLRVRDELVESRSRAISLVRALTRAEGLRLRSGSAETFGRRLAALELSLPLAATVAPVCQLLACINEEVRRTDRRLGELVTTDPDIARLTTFPTSGRSPRPRSWRHLTMSRGSAGRAKWRIISGWSRASTAPVSSNAEGTLCGVRILACKRCWSKRRGGSGCPNARTRRSYAMGPVAGARRSPRSPSWRSRDALHGSSLDVARRNGLPAAVPPQGRVDADREADMVSTV